MSNELTIASTVIGGVIAVIGCVIAVATYIKSLAGKATKEGKLEQTLSDLKSIVEGIRSDMRGQNEAVAKVLERVVVVERDLNTAWKRLDEHGNVLKETVELINQIKLRCAEKHGRED